MATLAEMVVRIGANVSALHRGLASAQRDVNVFARRVDRSGQSMQRMGKTSMKAGAAVGVGLAFAIKTGMKFDKTMSIVRAATNANTEDFQRLRKAALDWGASSAFSAREVAEAQVELGKAGFKTTEILASLPGVLDAASASGESMATVASIMVDTLTGFGLAAGQATMVADALAFSANETTSSMADFGEALKYVAPVAKAAGISFHETNGALIALAKVGIKGSMAGTNLRGVIQSMVAPNKRVTEQMKAMGLSFRDSSGNMKPLASNVDSLQKVLAKMPKSKADAFLARMFGRENISAAQAFLDIGGKGLRGFEKQSQTSAGSAEKFAAILRDNLSGGMEQLGGAAETAAIHISDDLTPAIRGVVDEATKLIDKFNELDPTTRKAASQLMGATATFLVVAGAVGFLGGAVIRGVAIMARAFGPVLAAARGFAKVWKTVSLAVQTRVAFMGGWMKVLGGMVRAIVGPIGSALRVVGGLFGWIARAIAVAVGVIAAALSVPVWVVAAVVAAIAIAAIAIVKYWDQIKSGTQRAWDATVNFIKGAASKIAAGVSAMVGKIGALWSRLRSLTVQQIAYAFGYALGYIVGTVARIILTIGKFVVSMAGKLASGARSAAQMFANGIRAMPGVVAAMASAVGRFFSNMASTIISRVSAAASSAAAGAARIASGVVSAISALPGQAAAIFMRVVNGIGNAIKQAPARVRAGLSAIPGIVMSIAGAAKSAAASVGRAIVDGIVAGIKAGAGAIKDAAVGVAKGALDGAKGALGIKSPSTVFRDQVGKMISEGLAQGILAKAGLAKQAVTDVTGSLLATAKAGLDKYDRLTLNAEVASVRLLAKGKAAGNALAAAYRTAKGELARLTTQSSVMEKEISKQQKTVDDLTTSLDGLRNIQLGGTQAFSDASFAKEQEQNAAALKMVQLRLQGLTDEDQPIIDLQTAMDKLGLEAEALQLQERLNLDPLRRQWEQTINPIKEMSFEAAIAEWASLTGQQVTAQTQLASMVGTYDALTAAIERMSTALQATLEAGQAAEQAKQNVSATATKRANLQRQIDNASISLNNYIKKGQGQSAAAQKLRNNITAWKKQLRALPAARNGAIVTRESMVRAGEGNRPEAIIPLDKIGDFLPGGGGGASGVTVVVTGNTIDKSYTPRQVAKDVVEELRLMGVTTGR